MLIKYNASKKEIPPFLQFSEHGKSTKKRINGSAICL